MVHVEQEPTLVIHASSIVVLKVMKTRAKVEIPSLFVMPTIPIADDAMVDLVCPGPGRVLPLFLDLSFEPLTRHYDRTRWSYHFMNGRGWSWRRFKTEVKKERKY